MSRYIDADKVYALLHSGCGYAIWEEPTIDLVRCKECKWAEPTNDGWNSVTCNFYGETTLTMPTEGFCSYGEREGE